MKLVRTPALAAHCWPHRLWHLPRAPRNLYLTFDDGPTPGVTDRVLDALDRVGGKATFFVVGEQARRHPELLRDIHRRGHTIGNHTHRHRHGYRTPSADYLADVQRAQAALADLLGEAPRLFRPPYGRLRSRDARQLRSEFQIVMWEVLAYDWRKDLGPERVVQNVTRHARPGSIVVLHDSEKAASNLLVALPEILEYFEGQRYNFDSINH